MNGDEENLKHLQHYKFNQGSSEHIETIKIYIENIIKKFIVTLKREILIHIFNNTENTQSIHTNNYWEYMLKDHIGLDFLTINLKL